MKYTLALVVPAFFAFTVPADELAFAPREGQRVTKTFVMAIESVLDEMEMEVNGEKPPMPEIENETNWTSSITVTDHFVEMGEGRPVKLERTFDGLSAESSTSVKNPMAGPQDFETTSSSELEGLSVVFTWNEETEAYDVAFTGEHEDEDHKLLEGLEEDMDLRDFLPGRAVAEGDTWEIDPNAVMAFLAPGGNLKLAPEDPPAGMDLGNDFDFASQLGDIEGHCTATYRGTKEVEGRRMGVVALAVEVESANDITELLVEAVEQGAQQAGMNISVDSADVEVEFELSGELLWDLESGHVFSLVLSGDTKSVMDNAMTIEAMGEQMDIAQTLYMSATLEVSVEITRE